MVWSTISGGVAAEQHDEAAPLPTGHAIIEGRDFSRYLGIPFRFLGRDLEGADCWGLCVLLARHELGLTLPDASPLGLYFRALGAEPPRAMQLCPEVLALDTPTGSWREVAPSHAELGDVLLMKPTHAAFYLGEGYFLHTFENDVSQVGTLADERWAARLSGVFRFVAEPLPPARLVVYQANAFTQVCARLRVKLHRAEFGIAVDALDWHRALHIEAPAQAWLDALLHEAEAGQDHEPAELGRVLLSPGLACRAIRAASNPRCIALAKLLDATVELERAFAD